MRMRVVVQALGVHDSARQVHVRDPLERETGEKLRRIGAVITAVGIQIGKIQQEQGIGTLEHFAEELGLEQLAWARVRVVSDVLEREGHAQRVLHARGCSKLCVNPLHLRVGSAAENTADAKAEGRLKGAKLDAEQVLRIVALRNEMGLETWALDSKGMDKEAFDRRLSDALDQHHVGTIALAGFMRILSPWFVNEWRGRIVNIHPSLLPKYRGLDTHSRALTAGDAISGCSVHVVTEELDALRTLGISPMDFLVFPRALALVIALPLLTVFADIIGVFGGMLIAWNQLGITFTEFLDRFEYAVAIRHYYIGIGKTPVFAVIIALIGCYQGFQVVGGVDSVGRHTTISVVQSIFLVIVCDAFFSVLFSWWGV